MTGPPAVLATNVFYYYDDVDAAWAFYSGTLGLHTVVDYGFAKILRVAESSYITLVNAADGMHSTDEPKTVTLAFVTEQVEGWCDYLSSRGVPMRSESGLPRGARMTGLWPSTPRATCSSSSASTLTPRTSA